VTDAPRLLIDTDPGVDDGVALTLALLYPGVRVEAITVVRGNAALAQSVQNPRLVVEMCGADLPVYAGADAPLVRAAPERPAWIHGADGFADLGLQPERREADAGFAPDRIVELVTADPGALTIVTLGPLTNLALALAREPGIARLARGLVMIGGMARASGTATPAADFNMQTDPEAARAVLRAGFRLTLVGIELSRGAARFTDTEVAVLGAIATPPARLVAALLGHSLRTAARRSLLPGEHGAACPDAFAIAVALDPSLITDAVDAVVEVETGGALPTRKIVVGLDPTRIKALLRDVLRARSVHA